MPDLRFAFRQPTLNERRTPANRVSPLLAVFFVFLLSPGLSAPADQQLKLLKSIPRDSLRQAGFSPLRSDSAAHYTNDYRSPTFVRGATHSLIYGIVCHDTKSIEDSFRIIDFVFSHQDPSGHLGGDKTPSGVAFWLCELNQAILLLESSDYHSAYRDRLSSLKAKILLAANWLALPKNQQILLKADQQAPNRLLFDALAYQLSGILADDPALTRLGHDFLKHALALNRTEDGVFLERGGQDSSYQAVSVWLLQVWLLYAPDEPAQSILNKAAAWEASRIKTDGSVELTGNTRTGLGQETWQGVAKDINYPEVLRALLYYSFRQDDSVTREAAQRLMAWIKNRS